MHAAEVDRWQAAIATAARHATEAGEETADAAQELWLRLLEPGRGRPLVAWSAADEARVRERYAIDGPRHLAAELGRSADAVRHKAGELGVMTRRPRDVPAAERRAWSAAEEARVRERYVTDGPRHLAAELGRSPAAVRQRAVLLGLTAGRRRHSAGRPVDWYRPAADAAADYRQRVRFARRWTVRPRGCRPLPARGETLERPDESADQAARRLVARDSVRWLFRRLPRPERVALGQLMIGRGPAAIAERFGGTRQGWHYHVTRGLRRAAALLAAEED